MRRLWILTAFTLAEPRNDKRGTASCCAWVEMIKLTSQEPFLAKDTYRVMCRKIRSIIFNVSTVWIPFAPDSKWIKQQSSCFGHRNAWLKKNTNKTLLVKRSSSSSPLWLLSHRWRSPAPPSPTQTPSAAFLSSPEEHSSDAEIQISLLHNILIKDVFDGEWPNAVRMK